LTGRYRAAHGSVVIRDPGTKETLAALAADAAAFVQSVKDSDANFRMIAISATVFDATRCIV
jgi:hypothetical protein